MRIRYPHLKGGGVTQVELLVPGTTIGSEGKSTPPPGNSNTECGQLKYFLSQYQGREYGLIGLLIYTYD